MALVAAKVVGLVFAATSADAIQQNHHDRHSRREQGKYVKLDQTQAEQRGALCLDGTAPGFFYKPGATSNNNKWVIVFSGGGYCEDEDECIENSQSQAHPKEGDEPTKAQDLALLNSDTFADYNQVALDNCDRSLFAGDAVIQRSGKTVYIRGKRIVDYTFDTLKSNYSFDSATEVLIAGGSGGGHTMFVISDYVKRQMPASVNKFGAVPMNGWYPCMGYQGKDAAGASLSSVYNLLNMSGTVSPSCTSQFGADEKWKCLCADVNYKHRETPMFVIQMLDSVSYTAYDLDEAHGPGLITDCIGPDATKSGCTNEEEVAELLNRYMYDVVETLNKSKNIHDGSFVSTCTQHCFYLNNNDFGGGYSMYKSQDGTRIHDALLGWWQSMGTTEGKMYLPCTLNENFPHQCEHSCIV